MAIPQLGEIPPAPPPPPKRAPPVQGKLKRTRCQIMKITAKTNRYLAKLWQLFFSVMGILTGFLKHFIVKLKKCMNSYLGHIIGFGSSTMIAILIIWTYSNGGQSILSLLGGNSTDGASHAKFGPPGLVIGVLSSRDNFMQRQAVRHTWAAKLHTSLHQELLPSQLVFVLGDQDCYVHPRLRASNPNHCPQLPDDVEATAADGDKNQQDDFVGEYDQKWRSITATHNVEDDSDRLGLPQKRCLAGLGLRTLTDVMLTSITVPYTKETAKPRVFFSKDGKDKSIELELKLETQEGEGPIWVGDYLQLHDGLEFEIALAIDQEECLEIIRNKRCEWQDGNGSVQYTHVMRSDGSVRPWRSHHCLPFTLHFENG